MSVPKRYVRCPVKTSQDQLTGKRRLEGSPTDAQLTMRIPTPTEHLTLGVARSECIDPGTQRNNPRILSHKIRVEKTRGNNPQGF